MEVAYTDKFKGQNEDNEIESIDEFHEIIKDQDVTQMSLKNWVFQEVDFTDEPIDTWNALNLQGAYFWGCKFPRGVLPLEVMNRGAHVLENPVDVPFKALRAFMYTQKELMETDDEIYHHYLNNTDIRTRMAQSMHDYCIHDALYDYLEGKTPVGFMGGHGTRRTSQLYRDIAFLARDLARAGFLVMTGGGPGAMEAANLGAYMSKRPDADLERALQIICENSDLFNPEYLNKQAADNVLKEFGLPTHDLPSLGIPTFRYGHEPSNRFATWQAKFFSNALREDEVVSICTGGIIFTPGSAGTRQEIFQAACQNHYAKPGDASPMVFYGDKFWSDSGVYKLLCETAKGLEYSTMFLCTDDKQAIESHLVKHAKDFNLILNPTYEEHFWIKHKNHHTTDSVNLH